MSDGVISIDVELNEKEFQSVLENMGLIVKNGSDVMIQSVDNLGQNFALLPNHIDTAFKMVPFLVNGLINSISSKNTVMAETGSNLFNSLADNIPEAAENIASRIPEINSSIIDMIANFYPDMSSAGHDFFTALTDKLPDAITGIVEEVPLIPIEISDRINEGRELMADAGFNLFTALSDDLPGAVEIISLAPLLIVESVIGSFSGQLFRFNEIGKNIVQGVWSGISGMAAWLASQVSGFFQGIIGGITGFLGIHSPSTLFKDKIGKNIALGVGVGIAEEMPNVANDMLKYVNAVVTSAERGANRINISSFINPEIGQGYRSGGIRSNDLQGDTDNAGIVPNVNITIEPSGDMRGFFEYLSMNIKRTDYLSGGTVV